ncbi:hypothetical protein OG607_22545 [Streptomyces sp. NBC_01537]|uniref:hypothetical protein n=1 Tax=Streptomyces sp. NBC_01537 TaxID=2903896 RepID=UPI00386846A5
MTRAIKRISIAVLATTAVLTGTVISASPAAAAEACNTSYQTKEFPTTGYNVDFKIKLCIKKVGTNSYQAYAKGSWGDGGATTRKFDKFNIVVRVERDDVVKGSGTRPLMNSINLHETGSFDADGDSHNEYQWAGIYATSSLDGGWSADGKIVYDIDEDGQGDLPDWNLTGSPTID